MGAMGMRQRDFYQYSKADLNKLNLRKMEADLIVFEFISMLEEFSGKKIIYAPGSVILINGKEKVLKTYFVDYAVIISVMRGTEARIARIPKNKCPYGDSVCVKLREQRGKGRPPIPVETARRIRTLRGEGLSFRKIAEQVGVSLRTVQDYVEKWK